MGRKVNIPPKEVLKELSKEELLEILEKCREKVNSPEKNSRNSSLPPSNDLNKPKKNQSLRPKTKRTNGGQPGHQGHTLNAVETPDLIVDHYPKICSCGCSLEEISLGHTTRQVFDLPEEIRMYVSEHRSHKVQCKCGKVSQGEFPSEVKSHTQYGVNVQSWICYLNVRQFLSYSRITELFEALFGAPISEGTVDNIIKKSTAYLLPIYQSIKEEIQKEKAVGSDETGGGKIGGHRHWFWVWQTITNTFIKCSPTRGYAAIEQEFEEGFVDSTLITDALAAQLKTPSAFKQLCMPHLLRELNYIIEKRKDCSWAQTLKSLICEAIDTKIHAECFPHPKLPDFKSRLDELLKDTSYDEIDEVRNIRSRLNKWSDAVFTFLYFEEVPFDNNGSERAIRNIKTKLKVSGGFRSISGADCYAVIRSAIDTFAKQGFEVFDKLRMSLMMAYSL